MTATLLHEKTPRSGAPRRGRTFGLFRVLAPVLTVLAFWLALSAEDPARAMAATGQAVMMLAVTLYAFRLKGRPVTERPPVRFTPEAVAYILLLLAGSALWAIAIAGIAGALIPVLIGVGTMLWIRSPAGFAWRETLVGTV